MLVAMNDTVEDDFGHLLKHPADSAYITEVSYLLFPIVRVRSI